MPTAAPKPCRTCAVLVHDGSDTCAQHKRPVWMKRPEVKRMTGRRLQAERVALLRENPFCVDCGTPLFNDTAIRDHEVPLAEGGADTRENTRLMCVACHDRKSEAERLRGRGLTRGGYEKSGRGTVETDRKSVV